MGSYKSAIPLIASLLGAGFLIVLVMALLHRQPVDDDLPFGDV